MNEDTRKFFEKLAGVDSIDSSPEDADFEPKLMRAEKAVTLEPIIKDKDDGKEDHDMDVFDEGDGQLAIDVYQTDNDIVVMAPVAGISPDDLDIEITPESVTVRGKREKREKIEKKDFLYSECYWGKFSRSVILPQEINPDHATASFKNGVLKITLPKINKQKSKKMKIKFE